MKPQERSTQSSTSKATVTATASQVRLRMALDYQHNTPE